MSKTAKKEAKKSFSNSVVKVAKVVAKAIKGKVEITNTNFNVMVTKGEKEVVRLGRWDKKDRDLILASIQAPFSAGGKKKFPKSGNEKWNAEHLIARGMIALTKSLSIK